MAVAVVLALYPHLVLPMVLVALALLLLYLEQSPLMLVVVALETINTAQVVLVLAVLEVVALVEQEHPQELLELPIQVAVVVREVLTGAMPLVVQAVAVS